MYWRYCRGHHNSIQIPLSRHIASEMNVFIERSTRVYCRPHHNDFFLEAFVVVAQCKKQGCMISSSTIGKKYNIKHCRTIDKQTFLSSRGKDEEIYEISIRIDYCSIHHNRMYSELVVNRSRKARCKMQACRKTASNQLQRILSDTTLYLISRRSRAKALCDKGVLHEGKSWTNWRTYRIKAVTV